MWEIQTWSSYNRLEFRIYLFLKHASDNGLSALLNHNSIISFKGYISSMLSVITREGLSNHENLCLHKIHEEYLEYCERIKYNKP
jgi:hypothetical protein